ncbi:hypothetical protein PHYBLDRAFT_142361 [Phycomyces blakesleeanus NRRL 1555(-)]|uniref:Uncharacterized protein n=1 Tax=Phycomyces blakesleeanus (strain ATCC 8743b / DSM 1359 / FGSC 10004 / NBRC 33097 / NRRL 1555) TaxID=763407 RepID=A0A162XWF6_PHYB8|nr:hypothetical protein PHYBLDRAFT_142361 [Phycomyces blakesleeanus NRRL 1555(-)]OAD76855.1 hypothetical protein PHYBLDRAFT_142361 [Phycomyces blakesleeanus NRRL 1555(-)]|eukprot:XP_018294895.1 hypothetical protein PHYBLDRAFT_142361 [Phycomyces blakesleeanus NRRL 1555(-)]
MLKEHEPWLKDPLKEAYVLLCQKEIDMQLVSVNCPQIAWLPPTPSVEYQCGIIKSNHNYMLLCPATIALVQKLWSLIDSAPLSEVHLINYALNCLPRSFKSPEEKAHGQILIDLAAKFYATKPIRSHHIPPPTQEPVLGDLFSHLLSKIFIIPHQPPPSVPTQNCA